MSALSRLQADLSHLAPMLLPADARALSVEAIRTRITLRVYLHGPGSLARWADLDEVLTPLVQRRFSGSDASEVIVQAIRQDRPSPLEVFGTVIWVEEGTEIAREDGRATES